MKNGMRKAIWQAGNQDKEKKGKACRTQREPS